MNNICVKSIRGGHFVNASCWDTNEGYEDNNKKHV